MWIMLTKKLPTCPSPPKLSIHWSTPWINKTLWAEQRRLYDPGTDWWSTDEEREEWDNLKNAALFPSIGFGWEHNESLARRITFAGVDIRVYAAEFNEVPADKMRLFLYGADDEPPSHVLVPNNPSDLEVLRAALETDLRVVYDAALVDGCTPEMALDVVRGIEVIEVTEFPPLGWYRCKPEYALAYADEWELEETLAPVED